MIVAGQCEYAAVPGGAGRIGMLERVEGTVDPRSLAIPNSQHAIDLGSRKQSDLLATPHSGRRQIFIQAGDEGDIVRLQKRLCPPQGVVVHAERGTTISRDKSGSIEILRAIPFALQHRQSYQSLNPGKVDS